MKNLSLVLLALLVSFISFSQTGPITGPTSICVGGTATLLCTPPAGTWTSTNPAVASIGSSSGVVSGVSAGVVTISYAAMGTFSTATFTVDPSPSSITCTSSCSVCVGDSITLSDSVAGGGWSSGNTGIATADTITGVVTGVSSGTVTITYALTSGCYTVTSIVVNPSPAVFTVTGGGSYCAGGSGLPVGLSGSQPGVNYQLYCGTSAIGSPVAGTGSAISFGLQTSGCTYTVVATFPSTGCAATMAGSATITVNPAPSSISCPTLGCSVCTGNTIALTDSVSGGAWTSSNNTIGAVGSSSGIVTGVASGVVTMTYMLPGGCYATSPVTVNPSPSAIIGTSAICVGASATLSSTPGGGTWSSTPTIVATIGSTSGVVMGVGTGAATISYMLPTGCSVTTTITVNTTPTITSLTSMCVSSTIPLSGTPTGGLWSSSNTGVATVGSITGLVTGITTGTSVIMYTIAGGCSAEDTVTVVSAPAPIAVPSGALCIFGTITLTDATPGGTWSSSNVGIATAGSGTGVISGVSSGTATITYSLGGGCLVTTTVTVNPLPAGISGSNAVCIGNTITLADATTGGTWSSAGAFTSVNSTSGVVTGVNAGVEAVTYTLPSGCFTTLTVTVAPLPCTLGMSEQAGATTIELFPNPAFDELTMKAPIGAYNSFTITNSMGQQLMHTELVGTDVILNVKALPPGVYYIMAKGAGGVTVQRFIKR